MEYIQCPHCQKKYGVNEKVRAASGKNIRCKSCQESFEITIFSTPAAPTEVDLSEDSPTETKPTAEPETEAEAETETSNIEEETNAPAKEEPEQKNIVQIVLTAILGLVLLAGLIFAYQLSQTPQRPKAEARKAVEPFIKPVVREPVVIPVIPQPESDQQGRDLPPETANEPVSPDKSSESELAKELSDATATANPESSEEATPDKPLATETPPPEPVTTEAAAVEPSTTEAQTPDVAVPGSAVKSAIDTAPENPSDDCKLAATDQWFVDYMITHGSLSGSEYIRMLDESSSKTEEVRNACNDKYIASKITDAARQNIKPEWIRAEINARASSIYGKETKADGKW